MSSIDTDYPIADLNVFLMMRFIRGEQYTRVVECITQTLQRYGLYALRADDRTYKDQLWENVRAYMGACRYGIAIFEDIDKRDFNPNISIELGYMLGTKPPLSVLILKERRLESLPTDILGHLYKEFDAFHIQETIEPAVRQWLRDIGIAKSVGGKRLLYVSHGGTCRCVMAKIATEQALRGRRLKLPLCIQNMALTYGPHAASSGARNAVRKIYGKDLAAFHRSVPKAPSFLDEADLVIAMDNSIRGSLERRGLSNEKLEVFHEYFGPCEEIKDPWPDYDDDASKRYEGALKEIRAAIEKNHSKLIIDARLSE